MTLNSLNIFQAVIILCAGIAFSPAASAYKTTHPEGRAIDLTVWSCGQGEAKLTHYNELEDSYTTFNAKMTDVDCATLKNHSLGGCHSFLNGKFVVRKLDARWFSTNYEILEIKDIKPSGLCG